MDKNEITKKVIQAVTEVQEMSDRTTEGINSDTKPIGGAKGFDSLNAVEATVILSQSLRYEFSDDNLFVSEDGKRVLSIAEISNKISRIIKGEKNNE